MDIEAFTSIRGTVVQDAAAGAFDNYPFYQNDVFSPEALREPFGHYRSIRNLGAVVQLQGVNSLALSRYDDVRAALLAPEILISGRGNGFNDIWNAPRGPELISADGTLHRRLRNHLAKPMMPSALLQHREVLKALISDQVERLSDGETFDSVSALAKHLPRAAISFLVGLPEEGRRNILRWATAIFNLVGPLSSSLSEDVKVLVEFRDYMLSVDPARLPESGWAKTLFKSAESGKLTVEEARSLIGGFVAPSLDTTINAKSSLLLNLARHRAEWDKLRHDSSLIKSAVLEGVRHSAVVRWFARVAIADYKAGEVIIPKNARVMMMFGSANRDERHYTNPDAFLVDRNPKDQLGWGIGPHVCVGAHLARLEMELLLEALIENVEALEVGEPVISANRGLYGLESLPMRMTRRNR